MKDDFVDHVRNAYYNCRYLSSNFIEYYRLKVTKEKYQQPDQILKLLQKVEGSEMEVPLELLLQHTPVRDPKTILFAIQRFCTNYDQSLEFLLKNLKMIKSSPQDLIQCLDYLAQKYELEDDLTQVVLRVHH